MCVADASQNTLRERARIRKLPITQISVINPRSRCRRRAGRLCCWPSLSRAPRVASSAEEASAAWYFLDHLDAPARHQTPHHSGGMHYVGYARRRRCGTTAARLAWSRLSRSPTQRRCAKRSKTCSPLRDAHAPIGVNSTVLPQLNSPDYPAIIDVLIDEKILCVETRRLAQVRELWAMLKGANKDCVIIHKCTSLIRHALKAESLAYMISPWTALTVQATPARRTGNCAGADRRTQIGHPHT